MEQFNFNKSVNERFNLMMRRISNIKNDIEIEVRKMKEVVYDNAGDVSTLDAEFYKLMKLIATIVEVQYLDNLMLI